MTEGNCVKIGPGRPFFEFIFVYFIFSSFPSSPGRPNSNFSNEFHNLDLHEYPKLSFPGLKFSNEFHSLDSVVYEVFPVALFL